MMSFFRKYEIEICIFVLAIVVRLLYLGFSVEEWGSLVPAISGADGYYNISQNLIQGNGFSSEDTPPYMPNVIRTPLQPYFLAGTYSLFDTYLTSVLLLIFIGSLTSVIGMRIARYVIDSRAVSIITGLFLALEPTAVHLSTVFYSETLFMFLFLSSVLLLLRYLRQEKWSLLIASAFLFGLATLARPVAQGLPLLFIAMIAWNARGEWFKYAVTRGGVYAAVLLLVLAPWLYRNYEVAGVVALTPQFAGQVHNMLLPSVLSIANHTSWGIEYNKIMANGGTDINSLTFENSKDYLAETVPVLLEHKGAVATVAGSTFVYFFTHDGMFDVLRHLGLGPTFRLGQPALFLLLNDPGKLFGFIQLALFQPAILVLVGRLIWIALAAFFFWGAVRYVRREELTVSGVIALVSIAYFLLTAMVIGLGTTARHHFPANPFIIIFAAYGALATLAWLREKFSKRRATF